MARYYQDPLYDFQRTDHTDELAVIDAKARELKRGSIEWISAKLAWDLLHSHDSTGISLDDWPIARRFVEHHTGSPVLPNGV